MIWAAPVASGARQFEIINCPSTFSPHKAVTLVHPVAWPKGRGHTQQEGKALTENDSRAAISGARGAVVAPRWGAIRDQLTQHVALLRRSTML